RRGKAEKPRTDHDASAVVGHVAHPRNAPGRASLTRRPAVRSAAVPRGMDGSRPPAHATSPGERGPSDSVPPAAPASDGGRLARDEAPGRVERVLRTVGFHLLAPAWLTAPSVLL